MTACKGRPGIRRGPTRREVDICQLRVTMACPPCWRGFLHSPSCVEERDLPLLKIPTMTPYLLPVKSYFLGLTKSEISTRRLLLTPTFLPVPKRGENSQNLGLASPLRQRCNIPPFADNSRKTRRRRIVPLETFLNLIGKL